MKVDTKTDAIDFEIKDPELRAFVLFLRTAVAVMKRADRYFMGQDVTASQFLVLQALSMNEGTMSHKEIARWTQTKPNNITTMINRLERGICSQGTG